MPRGTITRITTDKRKRTRWEARLNVKDRDGKRHQLRRRFDTKAEAERWLSETESSVWVDGISVTPTMTVAAYGTLWMERMEREWRPSTIYARRSTWKLRILPVLGDRRLADLTRRDCQRFVDTLASQYAPNYTRVIATQLRSMLESAVHDELIPRNPASRLNLPRIQRSTPLTWTDDQARTFLATTPPSNVRTLAAVMLHTGMRLGEALGLRWRVVDLKGRSLRIIATMSVDTNGSAEVRDWTKTESSLRTLPIAADLAAILTEHRERQQQWLEDMGYDNPDDLVFLDARGQRWHANTARAALDRAIKASDLPRIPPHSMRHTAASLLLSAGVPTKIVQELLGHHSIAMTSDIYQHVDPAMRATATDRLGALLSSATTNEGDAD